MIQTITKNNQNFQQLQPGIAIDAPSKKDWVSIRNEHLIIIVGLTGVGKTTMINTLTKSRLNFTLLPNRRPLTKELIIPYIAAINGKNIQKICRLERFKYTRQYQKQFPGGMGHILSQLRVNLNQVNYPLIFDGLRGENEVTYAAKTFKKAKVVILYAPLLARLKRLFTRNYAFDKITKFVEYEIVVPQKNISFATLYIPEASS